MALRGLVPQKGRAMMCLEELKKAVLCDGTVLAMSGYRKRVVTQRFMYIYEDTEELQQQLASELGKQPDNFTVYQVESEDGAMLYFGFFDGMAVVGLGSKPYNK